MHSQQLSSLSDLIYYGSTVLSVDLQRFSYPQVFFDLMDQNLYVNELLISRVKDSHNSIMFI